MPLTGTKGYAKKEVTKVGEKVADVASGATPSGAVVRGGKAAAKWALDKYRAYSAAKKTRDAVDAKKKAAAEKAKNEARADELYGKGTTVKPTPAPASPAKPTTPTQQPGIRKAMTAIERRNQRLREENPDKK
jgi:membrane protein involved in colicin uptake